MDRYRFQYIHQGQRAIARCALRGAGILGVGFGTITTGFGIGIGIGMRIGICTHNRILISRDHSFADLSVSDA